jgi:hypothetical protein
MPLKTPLLKYNMVKSWGDMYKYFLLETHLTNL